MRKRRSHAQLLTALILISAFLSGAVITTFGNWGMEVGRANESDQARLLQEWTRLRMSRRQIDGVIARALLKERQRQLLGITDGETVSAAELLDGVYHWWGNEVLTPAQLIAMNPAASCMESIMSVTTLAEMMGNRALLGMGDDEKKNAELDRFVKATSGLMLMRCRDEALDQCLATGRVKQIIHHVAVENKAAGLGFGHAELEAVEAWAKDALQQCAIYELNFNSTTKVKAPPFEIVRDRPIKITWDTSAGEVIEASDERKLRDFLHGQTEGDSDLIFASIKCAGMQLPPGASVTCSPEMKSDPIKARIATFELKTREYYIDSKGVSRVCTSGMINAAGVERPCDVGDNQFSFEFSGGIFSIRAVMKFPTGEIAIPFSTFGNAFYIAHQKDQFGEKEDGIKIERKTRGVYPVLYEFTYADQNVIQGVTISDSTDFRLIHKPEPKPFRPRDPEPIRKPLKPRPGA